MSEASQVQEVKEINLHIRVLKIPEDDSPFSTPRYIAVIEADDAKREIVASPFKEANLYFAFSELTGALHALYRVAGSRDEKVKREDFNKALEDIKEAIAYLLAYTISEALAKA